MSRVAFAQLEADARHRVLEIGFGGGVLTRMLLRSGAAVTGIDRSEAMVRRAGRSFAPEVRSRQASFLLASAEALPPLGLFDCVVSVNTVYFWPKLEPVLLGLARLLPRGGELVLCFQTPEAVRAWPGHRHGFTAHEPAVVGEAMASAGFAVRDTVSGSDPAVGAFLSIKGQKL